MTTTKEEIKAACERLAAKKAVMNGVLTKELVDSISQELSRVLGLIKDENPIRIDTLNELLPYLTELVPLLRDKAFDDCYEFRLAKIFIDGMKTFTGHESVQEHILVFVSMLRGNNKFVDFFLKNDGVPALKAVLKGYGQNPDSRIVTWTLFIVMWIAYKNFDNVISFVDDSIVDLLISILSETSKEETVTYTIEILILLTKNKLIMNELPRKFASTLAKVAGKWSDKHSVLITRAIASLVDLIVGKRDAKAIVTDTKLIHTIEDLCTNKETHMYYVSILYFLHLADVSINIAGKESIFLDAFISRKCFEKSRCFCFANIKPDVDTLKIMIEKCGDSFYELFQRNSNKEIFNKFSSLLFLSDEDFLKSSALDYQKVSRILDNTIAIFAEDTDVLSRVFSTKLLNNTKVTFNGKTIMKNLREAKSAEIVCLYCTAIKRLLERNPESIMSDFVIENGFRILFNGALCLDKATKDSIVKSIVGYLSTSSEKVGDVLEYIEKNNVAYVSAGVKERISGIFILIRIMVEHKKENFKICDEHVLDLVLNELRNTSGDNEVMMECTKALKVLVNVVPVNKGLVDGISHLCLTFREKNPLICAELEEVLRCIKDLNRPCSLFECKSYDEAKALLDKMTILNNAHLKDLIEYLKKEQKVPLAMYSMRTLVRSKNVLWTYDKDVDYELLMSTILFCGNEDKDENWKKISKELLEYIFKASLHSPDSEYFSKIYSKVSKDNSPKNDLQLRKRSESVSFIFSNGDLIEKFKNSTLSTDEKNTLVKMLVKRMDILPFFDADELIAVILSLVKDSPKDLPTLKLCFGLSRRIVETSPKALFDFVPNDFVLIQAMEDNKWDMGIQEDGIKIIRRSTNTTGFCKPKFLPFIKGLMETCREDVSIQEDVSLVLGRVHKELEKKDLWKRSDIIHDVVNLLGANRYNVLISENVLDFLCDPVILGFIKDGADINTHLVKVVTEFLCDENIPSSDQKEKAVLLLYSMLKKREDLPRDDLYSDIVKCSKNLFFVYGDGVKAHFVKMLIGDKQRENKFASEICDSMEKEGIRQPGVFRIMSKYISCAEENNLSARRPEIENVFEVLESYQKPDGGVKPDVKRVFQIMKDERGSQRIALAALKVLKTIYDGNKNENLDLKCLKRVKKIMMLYYGNPDIQRLGCEILFVYAEKSQFKHTIENGYRKELLFDNFKRFSSYMDTQQYILGVVKSIITLGKSYDDFMKPDNIKEFMTLIKKVGGMPEEDNVRKQVVADSIAILKIVAFKESIDMDVLPSVLECLMDLHNLGSFDEKLTVLEAIKCFSKFTKFHCALIKGGWLEFIMKDFKKNSTPTMIDVIARILCDLLKAGYEIDDSSSNDVDDDVDLLSQDESSKPSNSMKFVKEAMVNFVDHINLNEFSDVMKHNVYIDTKKLFLNANELLYHLLKYPSVRARIGDFMWLHYCVKSLKVIVDSGKFTNQKKDLSLSSSRLWGFDPSAIDVGFFESGLSSNDNDVRKSVVPAIGALLAHENVSKDTVKSLKQTILKAREDFKGYRIIRAYSDAILGYENKKVACALKLNVCTRIVVSECSDRNCEGKQGLYCEECCVPQDLYMCKNCNDGRLLCAHCKDAYHKDHETMKVLCVGVCQSERGVEDGAEKRAMVLKAIEDMENDIKRKVVSDSPKAGKSVAAPKKKVSKIQPKVEDDEPKEPEKKRRKTNSAKIGPVDSGCVLARLLDDLVSRNVSVSNENVKRDCMRVDVSKVTLKSALEKAKVKGVDEVCALCAKNSDTAYEAFAYCTQSTTKTQAEAICALQLDLPSVKNADAENERTPCEMLYRALLEKRRDMVDEVKDFLALVLSALETLDRKTFHVLFHAVPLDSPLLEPLGKSAGAPLGEGKQKRPPKGNFIDQHLSLLTFAATEMSTIMEIPGVSPDKYAVVILAGDFEGYDISGFSPESTNYLDVVLVPDSKIKVTDVAKTPDGFTVVTAQVTSPKVEVKPPK